MKIFIPGEMKDKGFTSLMPSEVKKLVKMGANVEVEKGIGKTCDISDDEYIEAGSKIVSDRFAGYQSADLILRRYKPSKAEVQCLKKGCVHVSFLDPYNEKELVRAMAEQGVTALAMEMIPRTTIAQKMDALSSQSNLAGYAAVVLAAGHIGRIFPMMMTAAGTIAPARVLVIGAGVAGLQAIATAKRLGARVDAFDTRPGVEQQIRSLGARFVEIDLGETDQTANGYARELTPEQLQRQRDALAKICAQADVVITTAQLFGQRAPLIVTRNMLAGMKPGSLIIDMAVETGGNVEGSQRGKEIIVHGVRIVGWENLPGRVAMHAAQLYSANITNLIEHFWSDQNRQIDLNMEDEILKACIITHDHRICHRDLLKRYDMDTGRSEPGEHNGACLGQPQNH